MSEGLREVHLERSKASSEGLVVSSSRIYITSLEGLRFLRLSKLPPERLGVSIGRIKHINHVYEARLKSV